MGYDDIVEKVIPRLAGDATGLHHPASGDHRNDDHGSRNT
jgi:hypothetical protein